MVDENEMLRMDDGETADETDGETEEGVQNKTKIKCFFCSKIMIVDFLVFFFFLVLGYYSVIN